MPSSFANCFDLLYGGAKRLLASTFRGVACTAALLMKGRPAPKRLQPCAAGKPFSDGQPWPYSSSFFNIFNYDPLRAVSGCLSVGGVGQGHDTRLLLASMSAAKDHGCLNAHRDRGVLTVVYGAPSKEEGSKLWLKEVSGPWLSPGSGQLLLWAGESFQEAPAVEHCVRVAPEGDYVEHSHNRRDPQAPETGNRRSVALVGSREARMSSRQQS